MNLGATLTLFAAYSAIRDAAIYLKFTANIKIPMAAVHEQIALMATSTHSIRGFSIEMVINNYLNTVICMAIK